VLVLTAIEGLSVAEAAEALGIPENAASTRLYRARAALKEAR
jgi:DNA-directed RNA polymerase specialized sigma24 family protein